MPELGPVVLTLQDRLAHGPTFQAALNGLFGNEASALSSAETGSASSSSSGPAQVAASPRTTAGVPTAEVDNKTLIGRASQDFADYQRLTAAGNWPRPARNSMP